MACFHHGKSCGRMLVLVGDSGILLGQGSSDDGQHRIDQSESGGFLASRTRGQWRTLEQDESIRRQVQPPSARRSCRRSRPSSRADGLVRSVRSHRGSGAGPGWGSTRQSRPCGESSSRSTTTVPGTELRPGRSRSSPWRAAPVGERARRRGRESGRVRGPRRRRGRRRRSGRFVRGDRRLRDRRGTPSVATGSSGQSKRLPPTLIDRQTRSRHAGFASRNRPVRESRTRSSARVETAPTRA